LLCELIIRLPKRKVVRADQSGKQFSQQDLKEPSNMKLISKIVLAAFSGAMVAAAVAQALPMLLKAV
jgi:hypothetical protein